MSVTLDEPFGATLSKRQQGNTLTIWSYGRDGRDHSGQGQWDYPPGKDLVLEVTH